jgi:hypothetical protein
VIVAPDPPTDPVTPLTELAAGVAEMYHAYVGAGIPTMAVAVMLGQWLAAGAAQAGGDDDEPAG